MPGVFLPGSAFGVKLVRKVNLPSVLYVLGLRTTYQMRGVAAILTITHQMPDNVRFEFAVFVSNVLW
jgi:hypothetical protein